MKVNAELCALHRPHLSPTRVAARPACGVQERARVLRNLDANRIRSDRYRANWVATDR